MNIIFLLDEDIIKDGICLSGKYNVQFDRAQKVISIEKNTEYVEDFWGENISECLALVGENGAGKTAIIHRLMDDFIDAKADPSAKDPRRNYIMIFVDHHRDRVWFYRHGEEYKNIKLVLCPEIEKSENLQVFDKIQVAYFHNALDKNDYFREAGTEYNFSVGNSMRKVCGEAYEMKYMDLNENMIKTYYDTDAFRIVQFLYDYVVKDESDEKIDFRFPQCITIQSVDENYIERRLEKELEKVEGYEKFQNGLKAFKQKYKQKYKPNWISYVCYNLFICSCLRIFAPGTVQRKEKSKSRLDLLFKACEFLSDEKNIPENLFDCMKLFIEKLRSMGAAYDAYLNSLEAFVEWLQTKEETICKYRNNEISVPITDQEFLAELKEYYENLNFEFPFLNFSFGISTGEYYLLLIFTNLYSMTNKAGKNVFNYSTIEKRGADSLLLFFDEADLAMHPRWQQMYMKWLTDFCKLIFKNYDVKIIVATHSPILLSDFPGNSVVYLTNKNEEGIKAKIYENKKTFGRNIHTLFLDSFFLGEQGTMGKFAETQINGLAHKLLEQKAGRNDTENIKKCIDYIGDELIKEKLLLALERQGELTEKIDKEKKSALKETLDRLKSQKQQMEQTIHYIEDLLND